MTTLHVALIILLSLSPLDSRYFSGLRYVPSKSKLNKFNFHETSVPLKPQLAHHLEDTSLAEGSEVVIEATLRGRRCDIELRCATGFYCVPMHLSIRPEEKALVFNARFPSGAWDIEERRLFFLEKDASVRITFFVNPSGFEITINDFWSKSFDHRLDVGQIKQIKITGDLDLESVNTTHQEEAAEQAQ
ncbi:unnamed protein product [Caenorhabditis brenneri]